MPVKRKTENRVCEIHPFIETQVTSFIASMQKCEEKLITLPVLVEQIRALSEKVDNFIETIQESYTKRGERLVLVEDKVNSFMSFSGKVLAGVIIAALVSMGGLVFSVGSWWYSGNNVLPKIPCSSTISTDNTNSNINK